MKAELSDTGLVEPASLKFAQDLVDTAEGTAVLILKLGVVGATGPYPTVASALSMMQLSVQSDKDFSDSANSCR